MITQEQIEVYKRRHARLKSNRGTWEAHWQECADYISPRKSAFSATTTPGGKPSVVLYDGIGEQANTLLVAGLHGMLTNPATRWFSMQSTSDEINEIPAVKAWLRDVELAIWNELYSPGSNFAVSLNEVYEDLGAFGTGLVYMSADDDGLLFQPQHLGQVCLDINAKGVVDTAYRLIEYTVRTVVEEWGIDTVSPAVAEKWRAEKWDEPVMVVHVIAPRKDRELGKRDPGNKAWASCYFEDQASHKLSESGYDEFPFACGRWSKRPGEIYGRGPGMQALPDIKMVNAMMLTIIKAAQKAVDPPLLIPDDGYLGPIRTVPGGVNYFRGNREWGQLPTSPALPFALDMIEQLRDKVRNIFHADIMQLVTEREMTLGEAQMRFAERMRMLGPVHGRLDNELLSKVIEWSYATLLRAGRLPPAPQELDQQKLRIEYVSPISIAQRQTEAQGFVQMLQVAGPILEADPALFGKVFAPERVITWLADLFRVNPDVMATDEERAAIEQQAQAMTATQAAVPMAQAANQGAGAVKALGEAQSGGGIDLAQLLGQMGASARNGDAQRTMEDMGAG